MKESLPETIIKGQPITALAPMQDVTTLPFMKVVNSYGAPDYFFTEYFRVHGHSTLEKYILESITENPSGRPVFAQLIGEDEFHLKRAVKDLLAYPIAGVDLNMGCPAPKVYKKNVGGGLLRDVNKVDSVLGAMRESVEGLFTVKMRIGFELTENFEAILELINKHEVDLLSMHGRTVKEMYRSEVHYDFIKVAKESVGCPVLANGNVTSAEKAEWTVNFTKADGVMMGRSAIRNPWIFLQTRQHFAGETLFRPTLEDVYDYIKKLLEATKLDWVPEKNHVAKMKKFVNFVGQGVDEDGKFLHEIRRAMDYVQFDEVCQRHLIEGGKANRLFATEPYEGVVARPNCEV